MSCSFPEYSPQPFLSNLDHPCHSTGPLWEMPAYDVLVLGATGFTGRLACEYLANRGGEKVNWAMAGRSLDKLEKIRKELPESAKDTPLVKVDVKNPADLEEAAKSCKVIINYAGTPYSDKALPVVEACVNNGSCYIDITGEVNFVKSSADRYDEKAKEKKSLIVHCCGFDSIPSDIGAFLGSAWRKGHNMGCARIRTVIGDQSGSFSGGTLESGAYMMDNANIENADAMKKPYGLDPPGGQAGPDTADFGDIRALGYDKDAESWAMPFVMAPVNCRIIRRSNALLGYPYGNACSVGEVMEWRMTCPICGSTANMASIVTATRSPRDSLKSYALGRCRSIVARQSKVDDFCKHVDAHLPKDGKKVVFATAWLATDNVFVALMRKHFPEVLTGMNLVAIDTLRLFPTALECAKLVEEKYGKKDEFIAKYGDCEELDSADFDFVSKETNAAAQECREKLVQVEPFQRALEECVLVLWDFLQSESLKECEKDILITGRRMDQAAQRIKLDVWEDQKRTLNPMANFSWQDITDYVDKEGVPVNAGHNWAFRCDAPIEVTSRHLPDLPWTKVDLGKPFWRCTEAEIKGSPPAAVTYVFKSFGDMHTTVPVEPHESERAGRFVRQAKTECGIHTRTTFAGAPHCGSLVDLMVKDAATIKSLTASTVKSIELNERQACDVFCLLSGAFSPLTGFMEEAAYNSVVKDAALKTQQELEVDAAAKKQKAEKERIRKLIITLGDENKKVVSQIRGLAAALEDDIPLHGDLIRRTLVECAKSLPVKSGIYAAWLSKMAEKHPEWSASVVSNSLEELRAAIQGGRTANTQLLLRFLVSLANTGVVGVNAALEFLKEVMGIGQSLPPNKGGDFGCFMVLAQLPFLSAAAYQQGKEKVDGLLADAAKHLQSRDTKWKSLLQTTEGAGLSDRLEEIHTGLQGLSSNGWSSQVVLHVPGTQAAAAGVAGMPDVKLDMTAEDFSKTRPRQPVPIVAAKLLTSQMEAGESLSIADRWVLEDYVLLTVEMFSSDVEECSKQLLRIPVLHPHFEAIVVEILFCQMLQLPAPRLAPLFYSRLMEVCAEKQTSMKKLIDAAFQALFRNLADLDEDCLDVLADAFACRLSNNAFQTDFSLLVGPKTTDEAKRLAQWTLQKLQRLLEHQNLGHALGMFDMNMMSKLPEALRSLAPAEPKPASGLPVVSKPQFGRMINLVRLKDANAEKVLERLSGRV
ncbi:unnamed protein product [Symbiodinium sp. KB8]|nr:unnamed protein product [Symbiodinium sp. KB8]